MIKLLTWALPRIGLKAATPWIGWIGAGIKLLALLGGNQGDAVSGVRRLA